MNKQELNTRIEELENELDTLKKQVANIDAHPRGYFTPEPNETYYILRPHRDLSTPSLQVVEKKRGDNHYHVGYATLGNCFKTKDDAMFQIAVNEAKQKILHEIKKYNTEHDYTPDFEGTQRNEFMDLSIYAQPNTNIITTADTSSYQSLPLDFYIAPGGVDDLAEVITPRELKLALS